MNLDRFGSRDWSILTSNTHIKGLSSDMEGGINSTLGPFDIVPVVPTVGDSGGIIERPRIAKRKPEVVIRGTLTEPILRVVEAKIEGEFTTPLSIPDILEGNIKKGIGIAGEKGGNIKKLIGIPDVIEGNIKKPIRVPDSKEGTTEVPIGIPDVIMEGLLKEPEPSLEMAITKIKMIDKERRSRDLLEKKFREYQESVALKAEERRKEDEERQRRLEQEKKDAAEKKAKREKKAKKRKALRELEKSLEEID